MSGLLAGIRVLDLTFFLPGPYATLLLSDMGADVIKVESRLGDLLRRTPPFVRSRSAMFLTLNRNKKSVGLNLKGPEGRTLFLDLCRHADVVMEGFRPGRAERLGVGPKDVHDANPRTVYCRLSGFGQTGPDALRAGHDLSYLARSGLLGLSVRPGERPSLPAAQIADLAAGTTAALAVCAALVERAGSGVGRTLDIGIVESVVPWLGVHLESFRAGLPATADRMPLSGRYPFYNVYLTADDRHVALAILEPVFWRDFCRAVGRPDLVPHQLAPDRHELLERELAGLFASRPASDWADLFAEHDIPAESVPDLAEVLADRHLQARGVFVLLEHPDEGALLQVRGPVRANGLPCPEPRLPPDLGEHTRAVLRDLLDLPEARINELVEKGAAFEAPPGQGSRSAAPGLL